MLAPALLVAAFTTTGSASAAVSIERFSVTPSTTQAGGHPSLKLTTAFSEPTTLGGVAIHLPAGLRAQPTAIPFCPRKRLSADFCPRRTRVGAISVVVVAYGLALTVTRTIYNVRPISTERIRFGVSILPSYSGRGITAELPVAARPQDGGLDIAVAGLPSQVAGVDVRIKEIRVSLKGVGRVRVRKRVRMRAFLTNPLSCSPATTGLDVTLHDASTLTASSSFTPTGCPPG
jgi:hypothetical protein